MGSQSDRHNCKNKQTDGFVPLEYYRYCSHRVPLQSLDDLGSFISVNAVHGTPLDHLRGPAQTIVQSEAVLVLWRETRQLLLHALQNPDGGQVGLQNHVQLQKTHTHTHYFSFTSLLYFFPPLSLFLHHFSSFVSPSTTFFFFNPGTSLIFYFHSPTSSLLSLYIFFHPSIRFHFHPQVFFLSSHYPFHSITYIRLSFCPSFYLSNTYIHQSLLLFYYHTFTFIHPSLLHFAAFVCPSHSFTHLLFLHLYVHLYYIYPSLSVHQSILPSLYTSITFIPLFLYTSITFSLSLPLARHHSSPYQLFIHHFIYSSFSFTSILTIIFVVHPPSYPSFSPSIIS